MLNELKSENIDKAVEKFDPGSQSVITASLVIYISVYIALGFGGLSFNAQSALGYVNAPDQPDPSDGAQDVKRYVNISARFTSPDDSSGTLSFYDEGGQLIKECSSVSNNTRCEVNNSVASQLDTSYGWYVEATDGSYTETSSIWDFTTEQKPSQPTNPVPSDGSSGAKLYPNVSAQFNDPDSSSGTMTYYTDGGTLLGSCGASDGSRCDVNHSEASSPGQTYSWYAVASDGSGSTQSPTWSFTTDPAPYAANPSPSDGEGGVSPEPTVSATYIDPDGDTGDIVLLAGDGSFIGSCTDISNETTCSKEYSSASSYSKSYGWYARTYDGNTWTTTPSTGDWSFQTESYGAVAPETDRLGISFENNRNLFTAEEGETVSMPLQVYNPGASRDVTVRISEGNGFTSFSDGTDTKSFTMSSGETRSFVLRSSPDFTGTEALEVEAVNQDLGVSRSARATVNVIPTVPAGASPNEVPGIGALQLLVITAASSAYFLLL